MEQNSLQLADLPGSATGNESNNGAVASNQGGGDDDDSDKGGDEDVPMTFPQRMMEILSQEKLSDIITWLPHGRGFVILQKKRFANEVMPKYFNKKSKFTSFTRKLNRWNFTRVTRGPETGAYYHPLFQKGNLRLCMQMSCISSKSAQQLQPMNPVALGLAIPQPGQPMGPGMVPMGGDPENNFLRLRQLEEQRQNLLLQQQKQQQQLMALAAFGAPPGPGQVGSNPGAATAPAPNGQQQPQQQPQQPIQMQPGQQQMPNHGNPMAANPYIAMLMANPQMMQMNQQQMKGAAPGAPPQFNGGMQMNPAMMQMNPAIQAQFFAQQQQLQNALMHQGQQQMVQQPNPVVPAPQQGQQQQQQQMAQPPPAGQPAQQGQQQQQQQQQGQPQMQNMQGGQQMQQQMQAMAAVAGAPIMAMPPTPVKEEDQVDVSGNKQQ